MRGRMALAVWPAVFMMCWLLAAPAHAVLVRFETGGALEGKLLGVSETHYEVRTDLGVVWIQRSAVSHIEHAPSLIMRYRHRRERTGDTPDELYALAEWCRPRGLLGEQREHLWQALRLDQNHAAARAALGFVRVSDLWIDGRALPASTVAQEARNARRIEASIQAWWEKRVRDIIRRHFLREQEQLNTAGREALAEISDPLAATPLFLVLSETRQVVARTAMVDTLARFTTEEAGEYLVVAALEDADEEVRQKATDHLVSRADPHVIAVLRKALADESERLVAHAAKVLAALRDTNSVPALIDVLTARKKRLVEVPYQARQRYVSLPGRRYWGDRYRWVPIVNWVDRSGVSLGAIDLWDRLPASTIGYWYTSTTPKPTVKQKQEVTVYFSDVRDALVDITGQDFGFDKDAWREWYRKSRP